MKSYGKGKKTELVNNNTEAGKGISGSATGTTDSKNLYQQLRDSEEKYRSLFELSPVGITILDTKGFVQSCNDAVYKVGGYSEAELVGKHFSQIAPLRVKDIPRFMKIFASILTGKVTSPFEVEYNRKDGTKGWTEIQVSLIKSNGSITGVQVLQRDITERKKITQAQLESRQRYTALFENLSDAAFLADVKTGRIIDTNKKGEELLGRSRKEIIGIHQTELHPPELADECHQKFIEHIEKSRDTDYEGKVITADGTVVPVRISTATFNIDGEKLILGLFSDITERLEAEETLRESEETFRVLFDNSAELLSLWDFNGNIIRVNKAWKKTLGYTAKTLGNPVEKIHPEDRNRVSEYIKAVLKNSTVNESIQYRHMTASGEYIYLDTMEKNIRVAGENLRLVSSRDISEQHHIEQALQESEEFSTSLLENALYQINVLNPDGSIRYVNPAFQEINGWTLEEVVGMKPPFPWWPEEEKEKYMISYNKALSGDKGRGEVLTLKKNGESYWLDINWISVYHNGKLDYILVNGTDITERLKAEETLKEEVTRRRILTDRSRDGIVVLDQDGNVYESNQKFAEMLGYTSEEVSQLQVFDWDFQLPREEVLEMLRAGDDTGGYFETKHRRKDGTIYDVEISTNAATFAGQTLIFCVCRNITERKQAEEALKESEEFRSRLLNLSPNPILVINPDTSVVYVNPAFEELTGFTSEELIGIKTPYPWWREEILDENNELILNNIKDRSGPQEVLNKKKTGEYFWVETSHTPIMVNGKLQYGLVTWNNINERKQAELALKESEDIRFKILDVSPNPIIVINPDGTNMYVNPAFEKLTGFSAEEVIGTKPPNPWWRESVVEEGLRQAKKDLRIRKKDKEVLFKKKNGEKFWVASSSTPVRKNGKLQFALITWNDITERKRAEEEVTLRAMLLDSAGDGINVTDLDGKFVYVNEVFCKSHGYNRDELMGMNIRQLVPQIDGEPIEKRIGEIITEREMEFETLHVHKDSSQMMMEVHSRLIGSGGRQFILNVERDISERHKREEEIKKLSAAIEYSPNIVMITDRDAIIEYVNDKYIELTGYSADEIIGKNMREIDLRSLKEQRKMWRALTRGEDCYYEYLNRKKDGELYYEATSISAIKDGNGEITHFVRVGTDITQKKRTEGELQRSEQQLRELSNHMRQIREEERKSIARNIHDNLGQSLTALKIDMSWLIKRLTEEQLPLIEKANEMAAMIDQNIQTVKKLSSELRPEVLDILGLPAAIEWYADEFSQRTGIKCLLNLGEEIITLEEEYFVDCYRILQESLINVSRHARATRVRISLKQEPDRLIMLIKDNGKGIAKRDRDETRSFGLMGMRERANSIGGKLEIKSTPGKGTTVKLTVPMKKQGE